MFESKSEQGTPSLLGRAAAHRVLRRLPVLSIGQHIGYAVVSFLLGFTYLNVLMLLEFRLSPALLLFSVLGALCTGVCVWNLIAIWQLKR